MNVDRLRADTPGCESRVHLNNAGSALMPAPVLATIQEHLELESRIGGYEAEAASADAIADAYHAVAELIAAKPENIAFTENATASYMQALSAIPFERGGVILTTRNDYVSNQIQFLSLQERLGVGVLRAPDLPEGGVDVSAMADLIRKHRPRLVCATHVPTSSGLVQDVAAIGEACREAETVYLLDACQTVGQMPLDVSALGCDFLSATSRKFLRGPRGSGFLYVSDRMLEGGYTPLFVDMRGADWTGENEFLAARDAKRYENWEFAWALVLGTGEAAGYANAIGVGEIHARVKALSERLREALRELESVRILDHGPELCAIVTVWIDGWEPRDLVAALHERRINASAQLSKYAVLHYGDRGVPGGLRLSPHYYNTEDEIDETVSAIRELVAMRR